MVKYPKNWDKIRVKILQRDRFTCTGCGATNVRLHVHHIKPLSDYGSNAFSNLTALCEKCHEGKHPHMMLDKAIAYMFLVGIVGLLIGWLVKVRAMIYSSMLLLILAFSMTWLKIQSFRLRKKYRRSRRSLSF